MTPAPTERPRVALAGVLDLIGNTPLLRLPPLPGVPEGVEIWGKAEWYNPGGSVKDRPALSIIEAAERDGRLSPGKTILDATSGNTGIAYAMIGAAKGYPVTLCLPKNASDARKRMLVAYGVELVYTSPFEGTDGAQREARRLAAGQPERFFYADQYNNPANWQAHYHGTAREIWEQTGGRLTHFVAGLGTSGTFVGTTRRLRELNPTIRCVSFQPDEPLNALEGLKHMATAIVPGIYDSALADEDLAICSEASQDMARHLARAAGLLLGPSAAAAAVAAAQVARTLQRGVIVTVFPDSASKYLAERFWDSS
jgi:S-sulfo-L-cysteine synthase (O-acetyl-L-serine-dependent)